MEGDSLKNNEPITGMAWMRKYFQRTPFEINILPVTEDRSVRFLDMRHGLNGIISFIANSAVNAVIYGGLAVASIPMTARDLVLGCAYFKAKYFSSACQIFLVSAGMCLFQIAFTITGVLEFVVVIIGAILFGCYMATSICFGGISDCIRKFLSLA